MYGFYVGCIPIARVDSKCENKTRHHSPYLSLFLGRTFNIYPAVVCLCAIALVCILRKPNRINNGNVYKRNKRKAVLKVMKFNKSHAMTSSLRSLALFLGSFFRSMCMRHGSLSRQAIHEKNREIPSSTHTAAAALKPCHNTAE